MPSSARFICNLFNYSINFCVTVDMTKFTNSIICDPYQVLPGDRELCVGLLTGTVTFVWKTMCLAS